VGVPAFSAVRDNSKSWRTADPSTTLVDVRPASASDVGPRDSETEAPPTVRGYTRVTGLLARVNKG